MPFGFDDNKEDKDTERTKKPLIDRGDLDEVNKIKDMLNLDEKVSLVANSTKLGMMDSIIECEDDQKGIIEAIPNNKAENLLEIIRSGMKDSPRLAASKKQKSIDLDEHKEDPSIPNQSVSISDDLQKLAKLK